MRHGGFCPAKANSDSILPSFGWAWKTVFSHPFLVKGSIGKGEQSREPTVLLLEGIDQDSAYFSLQFAGASLRFASERLSGFILSLFGLAGRHAFLSIEGKQS